MKIQLGSIIIFIVKFSEQVKNIQNAKKVHNKYTDRIVFEKQVAPLVLDIEEEREHDDDVDHRDKGHDDESTVHDHSASLF